MFYDSYPDTEEGSSSRQMPSKGYGREREPMTLLKKVGLVAVILVCLAASLFATFLFAFWFYVSVMKELNWK
jgi:hypothetical protein